MTTKIEGRSHWHTYNAPHRDLTSPSKTKINHKYHQLFQGKETTLDELIAEAGAIDRTKLIISCENNGYGDDPDLEVTMHWWEETKSINTNYETDLKIYHEKIEENKQWALWKAQQDEQEQLDEIERAKNLLKKHGITQL